MKLVNKNLTNLNSVSEDADVPHPSDPHRKGVQSNQETSKQLNKNKVLIYQSLDLHN